MAAVQRLVFFNYLLDSDFNHFLYPKGLIL